MTNKYAGMTVNERLYESGLIDKFYEAIKQKNVDLVISILRSVELNDLSIKPILKHFGLENDKDDLSG